jgi:hypothetical protein
MAFSPLKSSNNTVVSKTKPFLSVVLVQNISERCGGTFHWYG